MKTVIALLVAAWFTAAGTVSEAQAPAFFQGEFTSKAALALVFKNVDKPEWTELDGRLYFQEDRKEQYARGIGEFAFNENGAERRLFVFETARAEDNTCRACGVWIGAALFSHQGQRWRLDTDRQLEPYGSFGKSAAGAVTLARIGPQRYAVRVDNTWDAPTGHGHSGSRVDLFAVAKGLPQVFRADLAGDNHGTDCDAPRNERLTNEPCYSYAGRLSLIPGKNAEYDDIEVVVSGTHLSEKDGKPEPFNVHERFAYRGGKYEKQ